MASSQHSLQDIWRQGCEGKTLSTDEQKHFAAMARSRFHTFQMGMDHALRDEDEPKQLGLIRGLAVELSEAPGLKQLWFKMAISSSQAGELVTLQLEKSESVSH